MVNTEKEMVVNTEKEMVNTEMVNTEKEMVNTEMVNTEKEMVNTENKPMAENTMMQQVKIWGYFMIGLPKHIWDLMKKIRGFVVGVPKATSNFFLTFLMKHILFWIIPTPILGYDGLFLYPLILFAWIFGHRGHIAVPQELRQTNLEKTAYKVGDYIKRVVCDSISSDYAHLFYVVGIIMSPVGFLLGICGFSLEDDISSPPRVVFVLGCSMCSSYLAAILLGKDLLIKIYEEIQCFLNQTNPVVKEYFAYVIDILILYNARNGSFTLTISSLSVFIISSIKVTCGRLVESTGIVKGLELVFLQMSVIHFFYMDGYDTFLCVLVWLFAVLSKFTPNLRLFFRGSPVGLELSEKLSITPLPRGKITTYMPPGPSAAATMLNTASGPSASGTFASAGLSTAVGPSIGPCSSAGVSATSGLFTVAGPFAIDGVSDISDGLSTDDGLSTASGQSDKVSTAAGLSTEPWAIAAVSATSGLSTAVGPSATDGVFYTSGGSYSDGISTAFGQSDELSSAAGLSTRPSASAGVSATAVGQSTVPWATDGVSYTSDGLSIAFGQSEEISSAAGLSTVPSASAGVSATSTVPSASAGVSATSGQSDELSAIRPEYSSVFTVLDATIINME